MEKQWLSDIDKVTQAVKTEFGNLTAEELNRKPNPETWSIAQVIDHIITVNDTYYPIIDSLRKGTYTLPFVARFGFIVNMFGKMILGGVEPGRKRKSKTFPKWYPSSSHISSDIIQRFEASQDKLKNLITSSADLVAAGTVISSPASKMIVYKLSTAFDIIVTHEQRHLNQAREILLDRM